MLHDIFSAFVAAELGADWEKARAEHGDTALAEHLPRTDGQRRFDALWQIFQQRAQAQPGDHSAQIVTNVIIDAGRLAVFLQNDECFWPGCHVPVSACQADHTKPAASGGCTCPGNGAPASGRHNRLKQRGYSVRRDPDGHWHTHRSDGTEIL